MKGQEKRKMKNREKTILRYGFAGIALNLVLSVAKMIMGVLIGSRAVVMDAWNGFTDMVSYVVSIFSTMYASKKADREHPLGYGRLEYITSMFTTVFIVLMGLRGVYIAVMEIIHTDSPPEYNTLIIILMVFSLAAKLVFGFLSRKDGKRIQSVALMMSGTESIGDAVISAAILGAIVIYRMTGIDVENWLSILISLFIIKTGLEMVRECADKLLGKQAEPELQRKIRKMIVSQKGVWNVFNLVIHNYGENVWIGSVDIEVDVSMTAGELTKLTRRIIKNAADQGIRLTSVGICGTNLDEAQNAELWDRILKKVGQFPELLRAYAFSFDREENQAYFYVVLDPSARKRKEAVVTALQQELNKDAPDIGFHIDASLEM